MKDWFKQPASWISIIATVISVSTFYLVQTDPGTLKVFLPDRVGLLLNADGTLLMLIPITMTNTGAVRQHRHVRKVSARVRATAKSPKFNDVELSWSEEKKFISAEEYAEKHQGEIINQRDYAVYVTRAFPFDIGGGKSETRIYMFAQKTGPSNSRFPRETMPQFNFDLTVYIDSDFHKFSYKATYRTPTEITSAFQWAEMVE